MEKCCRIVLTGGPGGGKTTAADLYRREIGEDVVIVPEAATVLYLGGLPRTGELEVRLTHKCKGAIGFFLGRITRRVLQKKDRPVLLFCI